MTIFPLAILVLGGVLLLYLAKSRWPGWMGLPFFVLTTSVVIDLGTTFIVAPFLGFRAESIVEIAFGSVRTPAEVTMTRIPVSGSLPAAAV